LTVYYNKTRRRWLYDFERNGQRHAGYCVTETGEPVKTKRAAEACEAHLKRIAEAAAKTAASPAASLRLTGCYTVEQMFADYVSQSAANKRSFTINIRRYVSEWLDFLGRQTAAAAIDSDTIERFITHSRAQPRKIYAGGPRKGGVMLVKEDNPTRSDSTTNRYLSCLRAAINWATKRGKMSPLYIRHLDEPADLPTPISPPLVMAIWGKSPPHLQLAITLAVHTGMRLDEVLGLRWDWIDLSSRTISLPSSLTKSREGQVVFINDDLAAILTETPRQCDTVVSYTRATGPKSTAKNPPQPIKSLKRAWHTAQRAAGIAKPYRFHDLRATFCTAVLQANNNPIALRKAARHASLSTTMRYAKLADDSVRQAFDATAGLLKSQTPAPNEMASREPPPGPGDNKTK